MQKYLESLNGITYLECKNLKTKIDEFFTKNKKRTNSF